MKIIDLIAKCVMMLLLHIINQVNPHHDHYVFKYVIKFQSFSGVSDIGYD